MCEDDLCVSGEYRVELPDGRVQIVSYHADHENGFIADVRYEGEAHPEPAYHPAPAYHPEPYHEEKPKDYQFGYDVHGYDEYGNPNVHSRTEQRDGYNVKGNNIIENLETEPN